MIWPCWRTYLHIVCESLNVTLGAVMPRMRKDAERDGPAVGDSPETLFSSGLPKDKHACY